MPGAGSGRWGGQRGNAITGGSACRFSSVLVLAVALELLLNYWNFFCVNRNHLFRSIRLRFAHNALPTQRNLPNWPIREQLMEAIEANLLSHQIGSFNQSRDSDTGRGS